MSDRQDKNPSYMEQNITDATKAFVSTVFASVPNLSTVDEERKKAMTRCLWDAFAASCLRETEFCKEMIEKNVSAKDILKVHKNVHDAMDGSVKQHRHTSALKMKHIVVLRRLHPDICGRLRIEGALLLDRLFQKGVLSETAQEAIRAKPTERKRIDSLIEHLCHYIDADDFKDKVIPSFEEEGFREIAEKMKTLLKKVSVKMLEKCTFCQMKEHVSIPRLFEALFQTNVISNNLFFDWSLPNVLKWKYLLKELRDEHILLNVLEIWYPHLHEGFTKTKDPVLSCSCGEKDDRGAPSTVQQAARSPNSRQGTCRGASASESHLQTQIAVREVEEEKKDKEITVREVVDLFKNVWVVGNDIFVLGKEAFKDI